MNRILVNVLRWTSLVGLLVVIQPLIQDNPGRYFGACAFALALSVLSGAATILNIMHYAEKQGESEDE